MSYCHHPNISMKILFPYRPFCFHGDMNQFSTKLIGTLSGGGRAARMPAVLAPTLLQICLNVHMRRERRE